MLSRQQWSRNTPPLSGAPDGVGARGATHKGEASNGYSKRSVSQPGQRKKRNKREKPSLLGVQGYRKTRGPDRPLLGGLRDRGVPLLPPSSRPPRRRRMPRHPVS